MLQREQPALADAFYLSLWGSGSGARLVRPAELRSCAWLDTHQVTNPDAVHLPYLIHLPADGDGAGRWLWPRTVLDPAAEVSSLHSLPTFAPLCCPEAARLRDPDRVAWARRAATSSEDGRPSSAAPSR